MADLSVDFCGKKLENPFILASAPPTKDGASIIDGFTAGWAGAVTKSVVLENLKDKMPRIGWIGNSSQNYEMGSEKPLEYWVKMADEIKEVFPKKLLIASLFASDNMDDWKKLAQAFANTRADGLELNFSCPHSDHKGMGYSIGQDRELCGDIVKAVKENSGQDKIIMPKLPYLSHPNAGIIAGHCVKNGANAVAAINTMAGLSEIDLDTLKPRLNTGGMTASGGIGGGMVKNFAYQIVAEMAKSTKAPISAMGGVGDLSSIVSFLSYGANHLQACSEVMRKGYSVVGRMENDLGRFLENRNTSLERLRGSALKYVADWTDLDSRKRTVSKKDGCTYCGTCRDACMYGAISVDGESKKLTISEKDCSGCGSCASLCPAKNLEMRISA